MLLLFSCPGMSNSATHGLQRTRSPCPSTTSGVCSNSCPLSRWCHPTLLVLCRPLLPLPSILPSIKVFFNESVLCIRWPKYWSFSLSISPPNEYSGLISFRIDWFDLLAVQETLKSLLQHHSSKASVLWCSVFFMIQFSQPYMTTGKTIVWTIWTFVGTEKVKSLSSVWLFAAPWTVAHQAPLSMGFSRQEYWSGLPFPSPGDLPDPGIEPRSPELQADALTSEPPGKPLLGASFCFSFPSL